MVVKSPGNTGQPRIGIMKMALGRVSMMSFLSFIGAIYEKCGAKANGRKDELALVRKICYK